MSLPDVSHFDDAAFLAEAISQIGFGALTTFAPRGDADGIEISHLPVVTKLENDQLIIEMHMARSNPHWKLAGQGKSVFVAQGPNSYVSPSFYPSKAEHGRVVPTWAYIAVHAHGQFEAIQDPAWLQQHLIELTNKNESSRDNPWAMTDAPVAYLAALKRGIVGLRFTVQLLEGRWKVNQFKSAADRQGTIDGLSREGDQGRDLAEALASFPVSET